ncbi:MAG: hypothetical protein EXR92_03570 [Gemmatimonadetes bacterium]|nr:hypothetical protein [Gemmatimonadota bacterium]
MTRHPATVLSIDPADPRIPEGLAAPALDLGEVVVLLADREAHEDGWPAQAAVAIACEWSASGRRVVLADADPAGAGLHERVGAVNGEGVSDMVLYGASPRRVSWRPPGSSFLFVSAGTLVSDSSRLYAHPRWPRLLGAFRESGCVLLLYAPGDDEDVRALMAEGDRVYRLTAHRPDLEPEPGVIGLAEEGVGLVEDDIGFIEESVGRVEESVGFTEEIMWGANEASAEVEASPPPDAKEIPDEVRLPLWVLPDRKEASPEVAAHEGAAGADAARVEDESDWKDDGEDDGEEAPRASSPERGTVAASPDRESGAAGRRVSPLLIALLLLVLAGVLIGAWLGYFPIPGIGSTTGVVGSILTFPLFDSDGWG